MRRADRLERIARLVDRIGHAILERRALDTAVHVLDSNPRRGWQSEVSGAAGVHEAHHEWARRHALVETPERDGLLLCHELR